MILCQASCGDLILAQQALFQLRLLALNLSRALLAQASRPCWWHSLRHGELTLVDLNLARIGAPDDLLELVKLAAPGLEILRRHKHAVFLQLVLVPHFLLTRRQEVACIYFGNHRCHLGSLLRQFHVEEAAIF